MRRMNKVKKLLISLLIGGLMATNLLAEEVQPIMLKVGLADQVGGTLTLTETDAKMFQQGDLYFTVAGQDAGVFLNDVTVETTGGLKGVKTKVTEGKNGKVKVTLKRESKVASSITLRDFNFTVDRTVPEGYYDLEISGSAITDDSSDKLVIKKYIMITTPNTQATSKVAVGTLSFSLNEKAYMMNNHTVEMDCEPYIHEDGYIMVPIKYVAEAFGVGQTNISFSKGQVILFAGNRTIVLNVGSKIANVNGVEIPMDASVENVNGRIYVSASQIANLMGISCKWDAQTKTAYFTK